MINTNKLFIVQGTPAKETKIQDLLDALMGEAPAETTAAPTTAGTNTACQDLERKAAMTRVATTPLIFDSNCLPLPESELF